MTITTTSPRARTDRTAAPDTAPVPSAERGSRPLAVLTVAAPLLLGACIAARTGGMPLAVGLPLLLGPLVLTLGVVARRVATTGGPALGR